MKYLHERFLVLDVKVFQICLSSGVFSIKSKLFLFCITETVSIGFMLRAGPVQNFFFRKEDAPASVEGKPSCFLNMKRISISSPPLMAPEVAPPAIRAIFRRIAKKPRKPVARAAITVTPPRAHPRPPVGSTQDVALPRTRRRRPRPGARADRRLINPDLLFLRASVAKPAAGSSPAGFVLSGLFLTERPCPEGQSCRRNQGGVIGIRMAEGRIQIAILGNAGLGEGAHATVIGGG